MKLETWLAAPWDGALPFKEEPPGFPKAPSRLDVYAALVGMNGGPSIGGYGVIRYDGSFPYYRFGLHEGEAFLLMVLNGKTMKVARSSGISSCSRCTARSPEPLSGR